jgi:hypothetical protein
MLLEKSIMMNRRFTTAGLAISVLIGLNGIVLAQGAGGQDRNGDRTSQYGASLDARQHGYEHAYRDGADQGRQDRSRRVAYNLNNGGDQNGARGYEGFMGNRGQYIKGYREGYKAGYDDAYYGRPDRYSQIYGRTTNGNQPPTRGDVYAARPWSAADMAIDVGYRDGVTAGQQDRGRNTRSNFESTDIYRNADLGYRPSYGDRDAYRLKFRDSFTRGYQDGFGQQNARAGFGQQNAQAGFGQQNAQGLESPTVRVEANPGWTDTGIAVRGGDRVTFHATGQITYGHTPGQTAGPDGNAQVKKNSYPVGGMPVGGLVGRVGNGAPFPIGSNTQPITMPADGRLTLGVNDDEVGDNSGFFSVVVTRSGR